MKLSAFFDKAIQTAIENDPRGKDFVLAELQRRNKDYEALSSKEKKRYDPESLRNPYSDSRILFVAVMRKSGPPLSALTLT